jgi:hypothetical protein
MFLPAHLTEAADEFARLERIANRLHAWLEQVSARTDELHDWFIDELPDDIDDEQIDELCRLAGFDAALDAIEGVRIA